MHSPHTRKGLFGIKWRQRHSTKNTPGQSSPKLSPISSPLERKEVTTPWQVSLHNVNFKEINFSLLKYLVASVSFFHLMNFIQKWPYFLLFLCYLHSNKNFFPFSQTHYLKGDLISKTVIIIISTLTARKGEPFLAIQIWELFVQVLVLFVFKIIYYEFGLVEDLGMKSTPNL